MRVGLFGLGKLGLPLGAVLSQKMEVVAIDIDPHKVEMLKERKAPFYEPLLQEYLDSGTERFFPTLATDYELDFDIAIILVNTPSQDDGTFSNKYIFDAVESISRKIKTSDKKDFLFIISSTVMPGSHKEIVNVIENHTGLKLNDGFLYSYVPDLVALGNVIKDFENPDVLILGASNSEAADRTENVYRQMISETSPVVRMNIIEAEIAKVSLNAYVTMKISFANFIGNLCERSQANPSNVTEALGYDKRISPYYIKSGLSFGGTCFPRDTHAFVKFSEKLGLEAKHIIATEQINKMQDDILFSKFEKHIGKPIGIAGLSFKPGSTVTVESPALKLTDKLFQNGQDKVYYYDELVSLDMLSEYPFAKNMVRVDNIENFYDVSEVILLAHPNKKHVIDTDKIVVDPWCLRNF
jgi:UDPglucose 6-dehydrogenase